MTVGVVKTAPNPRISRHLQVSMIFVRSSRAGSHPRHRTRWKELSLIIFHEKVWLFFCGSRWSVPQLANIWIITSQLRSRNSHKETPLDLVWHSSRLLVLSDHKLVIDKLHHFEEKLWVGEEFDVQGQRVVWLIYWDNTNRLDHCICCLPLPTHIRGHDSSQVWLSTVQ